MWGWWDLCKLCLRLSHVVWPVLWVPMLWCLDSYGFRCWWTCSDIAPHLVVHRWPWMWSFLHHPARWDTACGGDPAPKAALPQPVSSLPDKRCSGHLVSHMMQTVIYFKIWHKSGVKQVKSLGALLRHLTVCSPRPTDRHVETEAAAVGG